MATVEDTVSECGDDCEFTSDNAIIYTTNITSSEVKRPHDTTEYSSSVGVTNSPGRVQINLNKPSPRVNESDFEPISPTEEIIISDSVAGVTVRTNEGVMVTNPDVAIEIKFPGKKPTEDRENVSVKFSFGEEEEEENEIDDSLIDNDSSGLYDVVTNPVISTTTQFVPPTFESLPVFEKDIFTTTEAVYNGILTPEETTGTSSVENKLPTAAETTRPEIINFTAQRPGTMTVNTSNPAIKGNVLINSDSMNDPEEENTIGDIQRPAMPRFDEIGSPGSPTENSASLTSTASTLIIESTIKTAKTDVASITTSLGDKDVSISQASSTVLSTSTARTGGVLSTSTSTTEGVLSTSNTEELLSKSSTDEALTTSTSKTEGALSTSTTEEVLTSTSNTDGVLSTSTSTTEELLTSTSNTEGVLSASTTEGVLSASTSTTERVLSKSTSNTEGVLLTSASPTEGVLSTTSSTEAVLSTSKSNTDGVLSSKETTTSVAATDRNTKLDESSKVMTEATNKDFVTDDTNSSNQLPEGIETAITGSNGDIAEQPEQTDISISSAINEVFTIPTQTISSTDKPIKLQTSTSSSSQTTIEQSSLVESHETLNSPKMMSSTEPSVTTITTFPSSAVKIPAVTTEEQQIGRSDVEGRPVTVTSAVLTTEQPTTNNISINDLTSESTPPSPFEIEQMTDQPGLYLTREMNTDREYSEPGIPSNTIIGAESVSPLPSEISSAPDRTKEKEKTVTDVIAGAEERSPGSPSVTQREDLSEQTSSVGDGGKVLVTTVSYDQENTMKTPTSNNQERSDSSGSSSSGSSPAARPSNEEPSSGVMTTVSPEGESARTTSSTERRETTQQTRRDPPPPPPPQPRLDDGPLVLGN